MEKILAIASANQRKARQVITDTGLIQIWEESGARVNLVGSLRTRLLMKHRDIDFHIYTNELDISKSFGIVAKIASHPRVKRCLFGDLADTDEKCLEWHIWYLDEDDQEWQIDMIQILEGSKYDGFFEEFADRLEAVLTPETREAILRLKFLTPEDKKIMGVDYYRAVVGERITDYGEFEKWHEENATQGVQHWMP